MLSTLRARSPAAARLRFVRAMSSRSEAELYEPDPIPAPARGWPARPSTWSPLRWRAPADGDESGEVGRTCARRGPVRPSLGRRRWLRCGPHRRRRVRSGLPREGPITEATEVTHLGRFRRAPHSSSGVLPSGGSGSTFGHLGGSPNGPHDFNRGWDRRGACAHGTDPILPLGTCTGDARRSRTRTRAHRRDGRR